MSDKTDHPPLPEAFAALGVRNSLLKALAAEKFETPSEIQALLIPKALSGADLLGQARTGTGKTAAFAIPILQMARRGEGVQALVLVPTRELAVQVEAEFARLSQFTPIRCVAIYGGERIKAQVKQLHTNPEVLVGTPGRVIDLLDRRIISLESLRFAVLDEVDRMLDIGFRDDIRNILSRVKGLVRDREDGAAPDDAEPATVQTIFVSATISDEIERLARRYMRPDAQKLIAPGADDRPTVDKVEQYYLSVQPWDKYRLLRMLLERERPELAIIFCRTKHGAEKLAHQLTTDGISCREIHGNLRQAKRDKVMKSFRGGKFDVLVATDLASRGIDVADISHIINYDLPDDPEVYVHRVGRTARMGAAGKAFTLVTREQGDLLTRVEVLINMLIPQATLEGFEPSQPRERMALPAAAPADRPRAAAPEPAGHPPSPQVTLQRPLTIGSKLPLSRRRRRL